jgi:two-component system, sensor histidine kinase and response regulator
MARKRSTTLQEQQPDLVIMDMQMPFMDGLTATREIRQRESLQGCARIPMVGLSASVPPEDRQACLDAGMDDFCTKPLRASTLQTVRQRLLSANDPDER